MLCPEWAEAESISGAAKAGKSCYNYSMAEMNEDFDGMKVTEANQREDGWTFLVELGHGEEMIEYWVDVDKDYWTRLTNRRIEPEELVVITFKFLLGKEHKELILKKFNLADITGLFPMYELEVKRAM